MRKRTIYVSVAIVGPGSTNGIIFCNGCADLLSNLKQSSHDLEENPPWIFSWAFMNTDRRWHHALKRYIYIRYTFEVANVKHSIWQHIILVDDIAIGRVNDPAYAYDSFSHKYLVIVPMLTCSLKFWTSVSSIRVNENIQNRTATGWIMCWQ